jgi:hypothetical protein
MINSYAVAYPRLIKALDLHNIDSTRLRIDKEVYDTQGDLQQINNVTEHPALSRLNNLYLKLNSRINPYTFEMVSTILKPHDDTQYWLINTNNDDLYDVHDWPRYAKSSEAGLAEIKKLIFSERLTPSNVLMKDGMIKLFFDDKTWIQIQPISFAAPSPAGRLQAEACFKNMHASDLYLTATARLSKLPGLSELTCSDETVHKGGEGYSLLPSIKTSVNAVKIFLEEELNVEVPLNIAQEITAYFLSGHTWQVLIAASNKTEDLCLLSPVIVAEGEYGSETKISVFRKYGEAVWHFAKTNEQKKLIPQVVSAHGHFRCMLAAFNHQEYGTSTDSLVHGPKYILQMRALQDDPLEQSETDEFLGAVTHDEALTTQHLRELFYIDKKGPEKIRAINKLHGKPDFLRINNWMFSIDSTNENDMLRTERIDRDGNINPDFKPIYTYIYKGNLEKNSETGIWQIESDYNNSIDVTMPDFDDQDALQLEEFSNLSSHTLINNP